MANCEGIEEKESIKDYDKGVDVKDLILRHNLDDRCYVVREAKMLEKVQMKYNWKIGEHWQT